MMARQPGVPVVRRPIVVGLLWLVLAPILVCASLDHIGLYLAAGEHVRAVLMLLTFGAVPAGVGIALIHRAVRSETMP
jgi:hypothetical protein